MMPMWYPPDSDVWYPITPKSCKMYATLDGSCYLVLGKCRNKHCHPDATCGSNGRCVCNAGFSGDGVNVCALAN